MAERADELFGEYASAYARGDRPAARDYLARAGGEADELARLIDGYLALAPAPVPDEQARELFDAFQAGESPLLRLRTVRGLRRETVVSTLVRALGLDPAKETKVARYYHELESGSLEPERVDRRVWDVLAETLGARVGDLLGWRRRGLELPAPVFARRPGTLAAAMRVPELREATEEDEIDRLFNAG